jgi:hypothetical protein
MSNINTADASPAGLWLIDGLPDWNAITFDVTCSRCGYNLRGLANPLCPECGLAFRWPEVLHRSGRHNEFLFEHAWRKRPVRSYLRTMFHGLSPRHFWRRVSIHDRVHKWPLLSLLLCSVAIVSMMATIPVGVRTADSLLTTLYWIWRAGVPGGANVYRGTSPLQTAIVLIRNLWPLCRLQDLQYVLTGGAILEFLVMLTMVCSLRQTLGQYRVRTVQVFRVVACIAPPVCILWCLLVAGYLVFACWTDDGIRRVFDPGLADLIYLGMGMGHIASIPHAAFAASLLLLFMGIPIPYLRAGLKHYLGLPHATAICIATFTVTALVVPTLFLITTYIMR